MEIRPGRLSLAVDDLQTHLMQAKEEDSVDTPIFVDKNKVPFGDPVFMTVELEVVEDPAGRLVRAKESLKTQAKVRYVRQSLLSEQSERILMDCKEDEDLGDLIMKGAKKATFVREWSGGLGATADMEYPDSMEIFDGDNLISITAIAEKSELFDQDRTVRIELDFGWEIFMSICFDGCGLTEGCEDPYIRQPLPIDRLRRRELNIINACLDEVIGRLLSERTQEFDTAKLRENSLFDISRPESTAFSVN